jgi:hypothetical protein
MASRGDPLSLHLSDQHLSNKLLTGDHNINNNIDHNKNSLGLFSRTNLDSRPVGCQLLLRVLGVLNRRRGVGQVGSHTTSMTAQWKGIEHYGSVGPTTVGDLGKAHWIHAAMNNCQEEHQSTVVLEMSGTVSE